MANDIDDSATFATTNMKPEADEEVTALWSQNIAYNTGQLHFAARTVFDWTISPESPETLGFQFASFHFRKFENNNTLRGIMRGKGESSGGGTALGTMNLEIEGTVVVPNTPIGTEGGVTSPDVDVEFVWDMSNATDNTFLTGTWSLTTTGATGAAPRWYLSCTAIGTQE